MAGFNLSVNAEPGRVLWRRQRYEQEAVRGFNLELNAEFNLELNAEPGRILPGRQYDIARANGLLGVRMC